MQQDENPPTQDLSERRCRQPRCSKATRYDLEWGKHLAVLVWPHSPRRQIV